MGNASWFLVWGILISGRGILTGFWCGKYGLVSGVGNTDWFLVWGILISGVGNTDRFLAWGIRTGFWCGEYGPGSGVAITALYSEDSRLIRLV